MIDVHGFPPTPDSGIVQHKDYLNIYFTIMRFLVQAQNMYNFLNTYHFFSYFGSSVSWVDIEMPRSLFPYA